MADYSFNPQFANLTGLQPLPAIDVTRGGALQFQALQPIQVVSSRPELVAEGIAGAVSNIAKGALSGITAKWEKEEEKAKEKRKYAHELMLYGAKEKLENADYFSKKEAEFIAENSGKPGFAKKYSEFKKAYSRFNEATPEVSPKEDYDTTVEVPLPQDQLDLKAEFVTPDEIPQEKPGVFGWKQPTRQALSAIPVSTAAEPATTSLENLPQPQVPPPVITTQKKPLAGVDYTKYEQPPTPTNQFETDAEALNLAARLNEKLKDINPDWRYEVNNLGKEDEWKTLKPVSIREKRLSEEQSIKKEIVEGQREERKASIEQEKLDIAKSKEAREAQEAEEKSGKITKANVNQYKMQIDQAAASVREINDLINLIKNNPNTSVGGWSTIVSKYPGNNAAKMARGMIKTIHSNVAFNALMELKKASPTGGSGLGALTEGEREALASTEGSFDLDNLPSDAILPRLEQLKQARLKLIDIAGKQIKDFDPEFNTPTLSYDGEKKKNASKAKSGEDMVSVISPDGKTGKIPRSQLAAAIAEGYKAQ